MSPLYMVERGDILRQDGGYNLVKPKTIIKTKIICNKTSKVAKPTLFQS